MKRISCSITILLCTLALCLFTSCGEEEGTTPQPGAVPTPEAAPNPAPEMPEPETPTPEMPAPDTPEPNNPEPEMVENTTVTITYLQNDGVLIADEEHQVVIDALFSLEAGWISLPEPERALLLDAQPPYDNIDVALATHSHTDHADTDAIVRHLTNNPNTIFVGPPSVNDNVNHAHTMAVPLERGERAMLELNGVTIEVLHLNHFDAFGNDFSEVDNYGYIVHLGGKKILHLGDVEFTAENFAPFGLTLEDIDVVLIPTFFPAAHLEAQHRDALLEGIAPANIISLHLIEIGIDTLRPTILDLYPDATIFTTPLETASY